MTEVARQACAFFLGRVAAEVSRRSQEVFPGHDTAPGKWLDLIMGLVDTASGYLEEAAANGTFPLERSKLIKDAELLGNQAYHYLSFASGSDAKEIPHEVVGPFKFWAETLKINGTIFFRAEHAANYELYTFDGSNSLRNLKKPSASLSSAISSISWPILRVTVPSHAMGMLPHFAVVAHELGHAIQSAIVVDLTKYNKEVNECEDRIKLRMSKQRANYGLLERSMLLRVLENWINELKADATGYFVVGPAFFLALSGFLELSGHFYGLCDTHPPSDLRRKLLVERMKVGSPSFDSVLKDRCNLVISEDINSPHVPRCPDSDTLFSLISKRMGVAEAAIQVELVETIGVIAGEIYEATEKTLAGLAKDAIYTPGQLKADIENHFDALCELIPPIEVLSGDQAKPTGLATILNVGWLVMLNALDRIEAPINERGSVDAIKMERLHQLLLKALELSEARRLWELNK